MLGGAPGANKSTLSRQLALDLASNGHRCLFFLSEETPARLKASLVRMMTGWPDDKVQRAMSNLLVEANVQDLQALPRYFARNVLSPGGPYENIKLLVVDSIQGHGTSHTAIEKWRALHELGDLCRTSGVSTLWITHLNKREQYAGLRATEHSIDAALMLRKSGATRHIGVPKNRFGPEVHRLFPLEIESTTVTLRPSPRATMSAAVAKSFLPGVGVVEVQGAVTLPKWGTPPRVMSPGLPRREIELLVACLAQVPGVDLDDLAATIQTRLPGDRRYCSLLALPLCLSLVASLQQRPLAGNQLMIGEVDLARTIRDLPELLLNELAGAIGGPDVPLPLRLLVPPSAVAQLPRTRGLEVVACATLDDAIHRMWDSKVGERDA
jgi:DNA repair protein RadA/Sms